MLVAWWPRVPFLELITIKFNTKTPRSVSTMRVTSVSTAGPVHFSFAPCWSKTPRPSKSSAVCSTSGGVCSTSGRVGDMYVDSSREGPSPAVGGLYQDSVETFLDHQRTSSQSKTGNKHRAVVSVCKNKHCCRRGANALYVRLADEARGRRDIDIDVRASGCLKHCKRGPACHVSVFLDGEEGAREVICVNVGGEHDVADLASAYTILGGIEMNE